LAIKFQRNEKVVDRSPHYDTFLVHSMSRFHPGSRHVLRMKDALAAFANAPSPNADFPSPDGIASVGLKSQSPPAIAIGWSHVRLPSRQGERQD
jgi:hypothetical protein